MLLLLQGVPVLQDNKEAKLKFIGQNMNVSHLLYAIYYTSIDDIADSYIRAFVLSRVQDTTRQLVYLLVVRTWIRRSVTLFDLFYNQTQAQMAKKGKK